MVERISCLALALKDQRLAVGAEIPLPAANPLIDELAGVFKKQLFLRGWVLGRGGGLRQKRIHRGAKKQGGKANEGADAHTLKG